MFLILWKEPVIDDADQARQMLQPYYARADDSLFAPSGELSLFLQRLLLRHPFKDEQDSGPWVDGPRLTGRLLLLSVAPASESHILADIMTLARLHGLFLYEPAGHKIILPATGDSRLTEPSPVPVGWLKIALALLALLGLSCAALLISGHWFH